MNAFDNQLSRRRFLQGSAAVGAAVSLGGITAACNVLGQPAATGGTFNWMTWGDHYIDTQLKAIEASDKIVAQISELAGNAEGFAKLKEVKGELDMISGDALWVPDAYFAEGLIEPFDINSLNVASQLYSFAREFEIWTTPDGYLGYPFGWSPISIYYNVAEVSPAPDSWAVLLDPKYKGRIVIENQPEEIVAYMGKASGVEDVYNMTDDQLATVKGLLEQLKPNVLKFAQQATDSVNAMTTGEAWLITGNLGNEDRVKDAGGPEIKGFIPKEGTVGWMDAEMIVKDGANKSLLFPYLEKAEVAENIAANFITHGRPLFNEAAYKVLVDQGEQDRADRYLYNKAEETLAKTTLKGPGTSTEKSIQLFNEVFGA
jgi:spermidine/putrescine-binding protein